MTFGNVVFEKIKAEKKGVDYLCLEDDKRVLKAMLKEINKCYGTRFHYLAEIDAFNISGAGMIMANYIDKYHSASVRAYLLPQIVADTVKGCDQIALNTYLFFKKSDEYISAPKKPAPAHIYVRCDNAFKKLKPKNLATELSKLAANPRDAFYLPFTMRMLASWGISGMEEIFASYLDTSTITNESLGLPDHEDIYYPPASFIRKELRFTAIDCLKYYSSGAVVSKLKSCAEIADKDTKRAIEKTILSIQEKLQ